MTFNIKFSLINLLEQLSTGGFSIGVGFTEGEVEWVHSSYGEEWVNNYVNMGYLSSDPTILHGAKYSGHFLWEDLERLYPEHGIFSDARKFGLKGGNTLSLCINGKRTIVSCAGPSWSEEQVRSAYAATSGLHFLHSDKIAPPKVSNGAIEVVALMAKGFRDKQIAETLGIKPVTVQQRRYAAKEVSGADTSPELVSLFIQMGLI